MRPRAGPSPARPVTCGHALPDQEPSALPSGLLGASVCGARPSAPRPCRLSRVLPAAVGTACVFWRLHVAGAGSVGAVLGRPRPPQPTPPAMPVVDFAHGGPKPEWSAWPPRPAPWKTLPLSWALVRKPLSKYRRAGLAGEPRSRPRAGLGGGDGSFSGALGGGVWRRNRRLGQSRCGVGIRGCQGPGPGSLWCLWRRRLGEPERVAVVAECVQPCAGGTVPVQPPCGVWCGTHLSELRPPVFSCFFFFFPV